MNIVTVDGRETKTPQVDLGIREVRLVNGEGMIAHTWFDVVEKVYTLEKPLSPSVSQDPTTGKIALSLNPLRPWVKPVDSLSFPEAHILYTLPLTEQLESTYRQIHSPIIQPITPLPADLFKK